MTDDKNNLLTQQTPITIAFALALCGGAYIAGNTTAKLNTEIEHIQELRNVEREANATWRKETSTLLKTLTEVAKDNKRRLDYIEDRLDDKD